MKITINDHIDLGVCGEKPCEITGDVYDYGSSFYVDLIAVDVNEINVLPLIDSELRADYITMLRDEYQGVIKGINEQWEAS